LAKTASVTILVTLPEDPTEFVKEFYPDAEESLAEDDYEDHDILHDTIMACIEDDPGAFFSITTYERVENIEVKDEG
jgi:hypothetical protein